MKNGMQDTMYHRVLRVSAVVCALMLLFESGIVHDSTRVLALNTHMYLANAVGMSVSVEPNEYNTITAELTAQKKKLDEREAALKEREIDVGLNESGQVQTSTYVLASILFIQLVLIILNYTLDYLRAHDTQKRSPAQTV